MMPNDWRHQLCELLLDSADSTGAWSYSAGATPAAEPTALAAIALSAEECADSRQAADARIRALYWLAQIQFDNGAVPATTIAGEPCWPTALALLAWSRPPGSAPDRFCYNIRRAAAWLLQTRGKQLPKLNSSRNHDTTLVGWPWVAGTHSWVEPTAYAIMALRASGDGDSRRAIEATRLIRDRALASGGWNYGNPLMLGHAERAFPATTGVALTALVGQPTDGIVTRALGYLLSELPRIRAPLSLAWGLSGLNAWNARPPQVEQWLEYAARRLLRPPANPHYTAMLLLAGSKRNPLIPANEDLAHA